MIRSDNNVIVLDAFYNKPVIEFDLGSFQRVLNASLRLYINVASNTGSNVDILLNHLENELRQTILDSAVRESLSAGDKPVTFQVTPTAEGSWIEVDITDIIEGGWHASFVLSAKSGAGIEIASNETCHSPKLVIVAEPV